MVMHCSCFKHPCSFAADCIVQRKLPQFAWDALAHASSSSSTSHSITNEGKRLQADVVEAWVHNTPAAEKAAKHLKALYEDDENHIILAVASRRWFLQAIIIRIDTARLTAHLAIWRQRRQRPTFPSSTCKKNTTKTTLLLEKQKHQKQNVLLLLDGTLLLRLLGLPTCGSYQKEPIK